jgi:hypothetical protein
MQHKVFLPDSENRSPVFQTLTHTLFYFTIQAFSKWINSFLNEPHLVHDLSTDLSNGVVLIHLVAALFRERFPTVPAHNGSPKSIIQNLDNMQIALTMLRQVGIMHDVAPQSEFFWESFFFQSITLSLLATNFLGIVDGDVKPIMGLLWIVILHYQMQNMPSDPQSLRLSEADSSRGGLLFWCREKLKPFPDVQVKDFKAR